MNFVLFFCLISLNPKFQSHAMNSLNFDSGENVHRKISALMICGGFMCGLVLPVLYNAKSAHQYKAIVSEGKKIHAQTLSSVLVDRREVR